MSLLFVPSSQPLATPSQSRPAALFAASTTYVAHLAEILSSLAAIDRYTLLTISLEGLSFFSDHNHILNTLANIDASLFSTYEYDSDSDMLLGIDMSLLSDLFTAAAASAIQPKSKSAAGSASNLVESVVCYIKYEGEGTPLIAEFEDRFMVELMEFSTFELGIENPYANVEENLEGLIINSSKLTFEVILKSDIFLNLLKDLHALDTEDLYMYVSNGDSEFLLSFVSKCALGYLKLIFPSDKTSLQKLEVYSDNLTQIKSSAVSVLNFGLFIRILKAVKQSVKCKLMKDSEGVISIQLLCKNVNCTGYPGTMVTFNMLEKAISPSENSASEVARLFDDSTCDYIREYTVAARNGARTESGNDASTVTHVMNAPVVSALELGISYASFKTNFDKDDSSSPALPMFF